MTPLSSPLTPYLDGLSRPCGGGTGGSLSVTQPIGRPCPARPAVREIAIVAMAGKRSRGGAFVKPEIEVRSPPGFTPSRRVDKAEYTVVVLRSDRARQVDPLALADAARFSFGKTLVVVQGAS